MLMENILQDIITCILSDPTGITDSFGPAATMLHSTAVINAHLSLCFVLLCIHLLRDAITSGKIPAFISFLTAFFKRSKIRSFVACVYAIASIWITFGKLLMVDERYISLAVILIILSVFIVALFVIVVVSPNPKDHLKRDDNGNANRKADGREGGKAGEKEEVRGERKEEESEGDGIGDINEKESSGPGDHTGTKKLSEEQKETEEIGPEEEGKKKVRVEKEDEGDGIGDISEKGSSGSEEHTGTNKLIREEEKETGEVGPEVEGKKEVRGGEEKEEESEGDGIGDISEEGSSGADDHTGTKKLREEEKKTGEAGPEEEEVAGLSHGTLHVCNIEIETMDRTGKKEIRLLGGGEENIPDQLFMGTVLLRWMFLCSMSHFSNMEMDMTNCLLFLSCCLGELTLMMAKLPSEFDVAPASEVVHRAFLVMGLLTAHTMAAELLGEYVLLVCMPELVAALAWFTIYLGSCDDNAAACAVRTVKEAVCKAELRLLCLVGILASIIVTDTDEAEGATDLLWGNMPSAIVAVLSSVILPSLCMLVLRQWQGQTTAAPSSSELEGAIRLLSLCRDVPCKALIIFFLAKQMLLADTLVVPLMFSVFCLILLLAASMYARAHGLHGLRLRAAGHGEKRD